MEKGFRGSGSGCSNRGPEAIPLRIRKFLEHCELTVENDPNIQNTGYVRDEDEDKDEDEVEDEDEDEDENEDENDDDEDEERRKEGRKEGMKEPNRSARAIGTTRNIFRRHLQAKLKGMERPF
ncbi:hypothetical protein HZH68_001606 [Vespula germanica]|uniref:Uncharacterized protein n=1 Tax=Vespula germanica TaxID=30212 RepID=A0A834U727_VESGE|nr:hypothetical protein HZH68_001606 [Vespula germanica]